MKAKFKLILLLCIISCISCEDQVSNTLSPRDLFPEIDNSQFKQYITEAKVDYKYNTYDYELEWEEIEYDSSNISQNEIAYYSLIHEVAENNEINNTVYRNNKVVGYIETQGLYKVFFTPIGGQKELLYDFSLINEHASSVYYKPKNCNGDIFAFPDYREGHQNGYMPEPFDISGNYLPSFFAREDYRVFCAAEDINHRLAISGIGYVDGILNDTNRTGSQCKLIQMSIKEDSGQWLVLYNLFDHNYYDYVKIGSYNEILLYIPKSIWKETFKYRLTHSICL